MRERSLFAARLVARALAVGWVVLWALLWLAAQVGWDALARRGRGWRPLFGQAIARLCERLGVTFIKLGQLLSTRYDLFPPELLRPLERLQDQVPAFPARAVPAILLAELGVPPDTIFAEFAAQPVSSASVACVYRAVLRTGEVVAVKIRRPGVVRVVQADLAIMAGLGGLVGRLPPLRHVAISEVLAEFGGCIRQQIDFRQEAAHNRRFRQAFAGNTLVRIPALVDAHCTEALLVMEFLPDLTRADALARQGVDFRAAILSALRALYQMIFVDGFIHCDLHPGNMYFHDQGRVTLLDMGFVKELTHEERFLFAKFFFGIAANLGPQCAEILHDTAIAVSPAFSYQAFEVAVSDLICRTSGVPAHDFQVAGFAVNLFELQRRFGLRGTPNFVMPILSLLVLEGMIKTYYADLDFQREAQPFLVRALFPPYPRQERRPAMAA